MKHEKPRVLVFRDKLLPLSETFVANQSLRLERYDAYFLGSRRESPAIPLPDNRVRVINQGDKRALSSQGFYSEVSFKVGRIVPREILEWAKQLSFKLIHAHFAPDGALALPLAQVLKVPLVVSLLGTDITRHERDVLLHSWPTHRLYLFRKKALQREARVFIVPSRFLLGKALERGYPREKLVLLPHGLDIPLFESHPDVMEFGRILFVGRLIELKGLHYLINALAPLANEFPELVLVVIGDGPKRQEYEALARKALGSRAIFLGAQPQDVVRKEMQRAYVFSMPSVTMPTGEAETFGMVYLEAQASGVPVVAFRSGGVPEVVKHGETGFLAEEGNIEELRIHLQMILERPDIWFALHSKAREWVSEEFSLKQSNQRLEEIYDELSGEYMGRSSA